MLQGQLPNRPGILHRVRVGIIVLVAVIIMTIGLVAAPQSAAVACEGMGGGCSCPGC